jgi:hypothetical protein
VLIVIVGFFVASFNVTVMTTTVRSTVSSKTTFMKMLLLSSSSSSVFGLLASTRVRDPAPRPISRHTASQHWQAVPSRLEHFAAHR